MNISEFLQAAKPKLDDKAGITLRDQIAMAALPSIFSDFAHHGAYGYDDSFSAMAEVAYALADAMLKEREK